MGKKRKTLPKERKALLESGELAARKERFSLCKLNALRYSKYGSNIFFLPPLYLAALYGCASAEQQQRARQAFEGLSCPLFL